jgi:hypothetical protein
MHFGLSMHGQLTLCTPHGPWIINFITTWYRALSWFGHLVWDFSADDAVDIGWDASFILFILQDD